MERSKTSLTEGKKKKENQIKRKVKTNGAKGVETKGTTRTREENTDRSGRKVECEKG